MWQPEQPSSQTVASFHLLHTCTSSAWRARRGDGRCDPASPSPPRPCPFPPVRRWGRPARTCRNWCRLWRRPISGSGRDNDAGVMPRELISQTCAPSTSAQTRTQRVHRMQRLWSSTKRGCDTSTGSCGKVVGIAHAGDAQALRHVPATRSGRWRRTRRRRDCARRAEVRWSYGDSCVSFGELVVTDMPSCTGVVQAGSRRSMPETSTMHSRQAPTGVSPSRKQSVGMYLPLARAAFEDGLALAAR